MSQTPSPQEPLYRQVYRHLLDRVIDGTFAAGTLLPSEIDLAAELGVSQGTARKAFMQLEQEGVIERRQGKGSFVAQITKERALFQFFKLRDLDGALMTPELLVQTVEKHDASENDQRVFGEKTKQIFSIHRIRGTQTQPRMIEQLDMPVSLFPGLSERESLPNTLYVLFQQAYGIAITHADEQISAIAASADDAKKLNIAQNTPLLQVDRQAFDRSGRLVETRRSKYLTDRHVYSVRLS